MLLFPVVQKLKSIASVIVEKNASKVQDYENIRVFLMNYEFITHLLNICQSNQLINFCLELLNELSTDENLNHHNFATAQAILNSKYWRECVDSQIIKIICSKNG